MCTVLIRASSTSSAPHPLGPAPKADDDARRSSRPLTRRARVPSRRSGSRPGSRSSTGRSGRNHAGLAGKPGRRSRENVALQAQLLVLPPQPAQFLTFGRAQAGISSRLGLPAPVLQIGLDHPIADRLGRGFEFASQIGRITPGTHQLDHLAPKLRRIGGMGLGHKDTSRKSIVGIHQTGATSFYGLSKYLATRRNPMYTAS